MIFSGVKAIQIPEGSVKQIECNGVILWSAVEAEPQLVTGSFTDTYSILKGYDCITNLKQTGKCLQSGNPTPTNPIDIYCNNGKLVYTNGVSVSGNPEIITVYADGIQEQTAHVENLFSCNQHYDEQDIITGEVTRRTAVLVLKGTESITKYSGTIYQVSPGVTCSYPNKVVCTHYTGISSGTAASRVGSNQIKFGYTSSAQARYIYVNDPRFSSADDLKAEFARLYNAGTPVMLIYCKSSQSTEQVTAQPLSLATGANQIVTTAGVSGISFDIEYWSK